MEFNHNIIEVCILKKVVKTFLKKLKKVLYIPPYLWYYIICRAEVAEWQTR